MLFGHQNDNTKPAEAGATAPTTSDTASLLPPAPTDVALPIATDDLTQDTPTAPVLDQPQTVGVSLPPVAPAASTDDIVQPTASDDLINLKQQALEQLGPLVGHLEQSPEEKFRTTMMMIQSSDNQALIKEAYAAAQAIPDDKARAQALLDIVNEINYFTQQSQGK